jgi:hypothetical protein
MSKNMRGAPAWTANARATHGLHHGHGDGTVAGKRTKRCSGANEKRVVNDRMPVILDVLKRMEPTSGLEPLTCRLRILGSDGMPLNPICFESHSRTEQHPM